MVYYITKFFHLKIFILGNEFCQYFLSTTKQRQLNNQEDYFLNYNILIKIIQLSSFANMHWHHSKELKRPYVENLLLKKKLSSFQFLKPLLNSLSVQNLAEVAATCPAQLPRDRKDLGSIPATKLYFLF